MAGSRGIRFKVMAAVNAAMALLLLIFLVVDYHREIAERVTQKHVALEEEARTLLPAIARLRPQGRQAIQEYLDAVCGQMEDVFSPGHHIGVRLDGIVFQAMAHRRASPEIFAAMEIAAQSPTHRATMDGEQLVVGSGQQADLNVYVSEYLTDIRQSARWQVFHRLIGIVLLVVVTAAVVNVVFLRMAAKPLEELVETVRQIARGRLGVRAGPFKTAELAYLADEVNSMSSALAEIDRQRRQQMDKARCIQEHLLPREISIPGLGVATSYRPANEVAGDYYDVAVLSDGGWLLCIADVSGHGVPAAMSAAMLKTLLMHAVERLVAPVEILRFINTRFTAISLDGDFASMILVRWAPDATRLEYASAGHGNAWFLPVGGGVPRDLPSTGLPLAVQDGVAWETGCIQVAPGDRLLLVTDGVTETFNPAAEPFGASRLADMLQHGSGIAITELVKRIDEALDAYRAGGALTDDCTVVAVEFSA